jgi:hypothetical protein
VRDYAKLAPTLWTGETGNALRARGFEGLLVATYLVSSPMSNMLGLFAQPLLYMAHETGLGIDGARKGLQDCIEVGFCKYDERSQFVFVHEMAKWQISEALKPTDLRCKGIQKDYEALPTNAFLGEWFDRYAEAFNLTNRRSPSEGAYQAPSKPGAGTGAGTGAGAGAGLLTLPARAEVASGTDGKPKSPKPKEPAPSTPVFDAYAEAYAARYGAPPVRNAKVSSQLSKLVERLGATEAPRVAAFFVGHQGQRYVQSMHSVDLLLLDAEKLRTEWATGRVVTNGNGRHPPQQSTEERDREAKRLLGIRAHHA